MSRPSAVEVLAAARFHLRPLRHLTTRLPSFWAGRTWAVALGPETIGGHHLVVRSPRRADGDRWRRLRLRDRARIEPFWATSDLSWEQRHAPEAWISYLLAGHRASRKGHTAPLVIEVDGELVGECRLDGIDHGLGTAELGVWIVAGLPPESFATFAVAMVLDHAFDTLGLHRVTAPVCQGNEPAERLMRRVGLRHEGVMRGFLEVGVGRADHALHAITADRVPPAGVVSAVRDGQTGASPSGDGAAGGSGSRAPTG